MSNTLETLTNNMQQRAERASRFAWEYHKQGLAERASEWLELAEEMWEQWVHLKSLTRLIGQVQELRRMVRGEAQ